MIRWTLNPRQDIASRNPWPKIEVVENIEMTTTPMHQVVGIRWNHNKNSATKWGNRGVSPQSKTISNSITASSDSTVSYDITKTNHIYLQQPTIKSIRSQHKMYVFVSATSTYQPVGAHNATAGKATQNPSTPIAWLLSRRSEHQLNSTFPTKIQNTTFATEIGNTTTTETTTTAKNNQPRHTEHRTRKKTLAADINHSVAFSHTRVARATPRHISIGTRTAIILKQMDKRILEQRQSKISKLGGTRTI
jgi:hypothetical protein